jgi:hypothetical protein
MKNYALPSLSVVVLLAFPRIVSAAPTFAQLTNSPGSGAFNIWLMTDGTVLAQLTSDAKSLKKLTPDVNGNYYDGNWSSVGSFSLAKVFYASQVLSDGRLVACGGEYTGPGLPNTESNFCEIYNPVYRTSTQLTPPSGWTNIGDAPSTVLPNGTMIVGGTQGNGTQEAVLNPQSLTWTFTTGDQQAEQGHALLQTGDVLTARVGSQGSNRYSVGTGFSADAQVPVVLGNASEIGAGITLMDGRVLWLGATGSTALYTASAGQSGSWAAGPNLPTVSGNQLVSSDMHAFLEPNGNVLAVVGGNNNPNQFVEYLTSSNTFSLVTGGPSGFPSTSTSGDTVMLVLPNGHGLVALSNGQWYDIQFASGVQTAWAPAITDGPLALILGTKAVITGKQLCGLSEVTDDSDDGQNAQNYPIVGVNDGQGHTTYLRAHDVTSRSIAPGQAASVTVDIQSNLGTNTLAIQTYAMGITSTNSVANLRAIKNFLPPVLSLLLDD